MMHLRPEQLMDAVNGGGDDHTERHVAACVACRDQVQRLRAMMTDVRQDAVPEPSPLFWEHLSARVRAQIDEEPAPSTYGWMSADGWRFAAPVGFVTAMLLTLAADWWVGGDLSTPPPAPPTAASVVAAREPGPVPDLLADDQQWAVMTAIVDAAGAETASTGLDVRPGAADRAAAQLTGEESAELVRLLRHEIAQSGS